MIGNAERARREREEAAKPPLALLRFGEMLEPDLEDRSLVKGLLETSALALLVGLPGCGKTFLALDVALHVAMGRAWRGRRVRKGRVVYVAAEAGRSIKNRVAAFAMERGVSDLDFAAVVSPVNLRKMDDHDVDRLVSAIGEAGGADLVVVDTLSRAMSGGEENSSEHMGAFIRGMDEIREALRCAVVVVHHLGKTEGRGARGHSLLIGAVDTEIQVERREAEGGAPVSVATVTKQRDMAGGLQVGFRLRPIELGRDGHGDPVTSCVVEPAEVPEKEAASGKGAASPSPSKRAEAALATLRRLCDGQLPLEGDEPRWVEVDAWREAVEAGDAFGVEGAAFRMAWKRALEELAKRREVITEDGRARPVIF